MPIRQPSSQSIHIGSRQTGLQLLAQKRRLRKLTHAHTIVNDVNVRHRMGIDRHDVQCPILVDHFDHPIVKALRVPHIALQFPFTTGPSLFQGRIVQKSKVDLFLELIRPRAGQYDHGNMRLQNSPVRTIVRQRIWRQTSPPGVFRFQCSHENIMVVSRTKDRNCGPKPMVRSKPTTARRHLKPTAHPVANLQNGTRPTQWIFAYRDRVTLDIPWE